MSDKSNNQCEQLLYALIDMFKDLLKDYEAKKIDKEKECIDYSNKERLDFTIQGNIKGDVMHSAMRLLEESSILAGHVYCFKKVIKTFEKMLEASQAESKP